MAESGLAEVLASRIEELDKLGNPTLAFQASGIDGIKVRLVAKCDDEAAAQRLLDAEEALMRGLLGDVVFGVDEQSMETVVLDLLRRRSMTLAAAETVTGGILSARMTAADPAMATFRGARILRDPWKAGGPSAEERAASVAAQTRAELGADVGLAAIAPEAAEDHAAGSVFLCANIAGTEHREKVLLTPDRRRMREFSVISLLNLLRRRLAA
jgi:nicotinamide-nucleotide amidase